VKGVSGKVAIGSAYLRSLNGESLFYEMLFVFCLRNEMEYRWIMPPAATIWEKKHLNHAAREMLRGKRGE